MNSNLIESYSNLSGLNFVQALSKLANRELTTWADVKQELTRRDENTGQLVYSFGFKENADLVLVYVNDPQPDEIPRNSSQEVQEFENNFRSLVLEKSSLATLVTQVGGFYHNEEATKFLEGKNWEQVVCYPSYEGTQITVFYHGNTWYVTTRRCLNSNMSNWVRGTSFRDMFEEAIANKFSFDDLDKDMCYFFVLIHHKNRGLVSYDYLGPDYKEVINILITKKYTGEEIDTEINTRITKQLNLNFDNFEELSNKLDNTNTSDESNKYITSEGFYLRYYLGEVHKSNFVSLKFQTELYQKMHSLKPNNSNPHQAYLELYQKDLLIDYLTYTNQMHRNDTIKRVHTSMRTLAKEFLDLYHLTRQKRNPELYSELPDNYKKVLYSLHGMYITRIKENNKEEKKERDDIEESGEPVSNSINIHDVYHYLKNLTAPQLRHLFYERVGALNNNLVASYLNASCVHTLSLQLLMFGEL